MPVPSSNRQQTVWAQLQPGGSRVVPNSGGTWTNTTAVKLRYDTLGITPENQLMTPTYKTGTRSPLLGVRGRQGASWTLSKDLIPSGALGWVPDDDPILQAVFGAPATAVASTSVTYNLGETIYFLFFSRYNKTPGMTNPTNAYLLGSVPQSCKFTGGGNFLKYDISGGAVGTGTSLNFGSYSGADSVLKGGLTSYPAEPGTVVQAGNVIPGFGQGAGFSYGGSSIAEVRGTIEISMELGIDVIADGVSDPYNIAFIPGLRQISLSKITCLDTDGTVLNSLKTAAFTKAPATVSIQFGQTAGSIFTFNLNNVQPGAMAWEESGAALNVAFNNSMAHATSTSVTDDMTLVQT